MLRRECRRIGEHRVRLKSAQKVLSGADATPRQPKAETWQVGQQTVTLGDCLPCLHAMSSETVDVVVTSPPYNIGVAYRSYHDRRPREAYLAWLAEIGRELHRVMRPDASFFLNVGSTNRDPWVAQDVAAAFRDTFVLQNHIVWVKSISIGDDTIGHFKPIPSPRFLNHNHESIFHFTRSGAVPLDRVGVGVPFKDKSNIARWGHKADRRCAGNVWFIPYRTVKSRARRNSTIRRGSRWNCRIAASACTDTSRRRCWTRSWAPAATLVAAQRLNCTGIGIELDQTYATTAVARITQELG